MSKLIYEKITEKPEKQQAKRAKTPVVKPEPLRMTYENYVYVRSLIEADMKKLERDFQVACNFIPSEGYDPKRKSGLDKAHAIFSQEYAKRNQTLNELHAAAAATYKDHPNLAMRDFWGVG